MTTCNGTWFRVETLDEEHVLTSSITLGNPDPVSGYCVDPTTLTRILGEAGYVREVMPDVQ